MKVFLINPDYLIYPFPPLGLAYLTGYIKKHLPHIKIQILDQIPEKKIIKKIKTEKPDIIGFSSTSSHHWKVKELALKVKKISNAVLVLGGIHVTNYPKTMKNSPFHIGVLGEGEVTFKILLQHIEKNKSLNFNKLKKTRGFVFEFKNKLYITGNRERVNDLDEIPIPAREELNMKYYSLPSFSDIDTFEPTGLLFTSRGCPYNCTFCSSTKFWGRCVKFFSAKRVSEEIEILYKKYDYRIIQVYDDLFSINKKRLKEIISLLKKKKILGKVKFKVFGRGNCFDEETAKILKELNVVEVGFGIETGSEKMLKYLKNNITLKDNIAALRLCRKYNIQPIGAFMIGMPYETEDDVKKTYEFIKKYNPDKFVISQMTPYPGTFIWEYALKHGLIKEDLFEKEDRRFLDFNENYSLSLDISPQVLKQYWMKVPSLNKEIVFGSSRLPAFFNIKNKFNLNRLSTLRAAHIKSILSLIFFKKIHNLAIKREQQG